MQDVLWRLQATAMEVAERADSHTRIEVIQLEEAFETHLAEAEAISATPETDVLVAAIRGQFSRYRQYIHRRLDPPSTAGSFAPPPMEMARLAHTITESCKNLLKIHERLIAASTAQRSRLRTAFTQIMAVLWIGGPAVGIVWGLWVARGRRRSISQISISLTDAAGGLAHEVGHVDLLPSDDLPALQQQVQVVSSRVKEVVDQLQQARRETMLADRLVAVGEMAAGVAHELRNPLTSVKLLIQTAADGPPDQRLSEEHIHVVLEQIVRMESTIQGLLDFARPPQMQFVHHDLRDTLRRAPEPDRGPRQTARSHHLRILSEHTCPGGRRSRATPPGLRQSAPQWRRIDARGRTTARSPSRTKGHRKLSAGSCSPIREPVFRSRSCSGCSSPSSRTKNGELAWGWPSADVLWNSTAGSSPPPTEKACGALFTVELPIGRGACSDHGSVEGSTLQDAREDARAQTAHH